MTGQSNFRNPAGVARLLIAGACVTSCVLGGACGPSATYSRLSAAEGTGGEGGGGGSGTGASGAGGVIGTGGVFGTGGVMGDGGEIGSGGAVGTGGGVGGGGAVGTGGGTGGGGAIGRGGAIGTGGVGMGGNSGRGGRGAGGAGGVGTGGASGDSARYSFEAGTQGWMGSTDAGLTLFTTVATSAAQHFAGTSAFAGSVTMPAGGLSALSVRPPLAPVPAGTTVTYHLFVPGGSLIDYVQPYVQEAVSFLFTGTTHVLAAAEFGNWVTLTVMVPTNSIAIGTIGVQFHESGTAGTSTVYIDSINW